MKRFNKISILVLALSLALVACGKGNMESQKETVKETVKETTKEESKDDKKDGLSLVKVVKIEDLKDKEVTEISKHGDHWHIITKEGEEFLTYEDPSQAFPNIEIKEYEGHHGDHDHDHDHDHGHDHDHNHDHDHDEDKKSGRSNSTSRLASNPVKKHQA